jgi:hypothetical protein
MDVTVVIAAGFVPTSREFFAPASTAPMTHASGSRRRDVTWRCSASGGVAINLPPSPS